jgi:hypothetical protein
MFYAMAKNTTAELQVERRRISSSAALPIFEPFFTFFGILAVAMVPDIKPFRAAHKILMLKLSAYALI